MARQAPASQTPNRPAYSAGLNVAMAATLAVVSVPLGTRAVLAGTRFLEAGTYVEDARTHCVP